MSIQQHTNKYITISINVDRHMKSLGARHFFASTVGTGLAPVRETGAHLS